MPDYAEELALAALKIQAIKFNIEQPFCWASGYYMPIYNDNRMLLGSYEHRMLVVKGLKEILQSKALQPNTIAGVATAGIPHAVGLANELKLPLVYVRAQAKDHGMQNRIEGLLPPDPTAVLIEDVVSTGGSSVDAVKALRQGGAKADACLCIYSYEFEQALQCFESENCSLHAVLTYDTLLRVARRAEYLSQPQFTELERWQQDPFSWGEKHGFPRKV